MRVAGILHLHMDIGVFRIAAFICGLLKYLRLGEHDPTGLAFAAEILRIVHAADPQHIRSFSGRRGSIFKYEPGDVAYDLIAHMSVHKIIRSIAHARRRGENMAEAFIFLCG